MNIVVAMDSFKGSLTSCDAGEAVRSGILSVYPSASVSVVPVSDGGEGLTDSLIGSLGGSYVSVPVTGPAGNKVTAKYGILGSSAAVIEMAQASGLTLVPEDMRDPMHATSYGTGELIKDALDKGIRRFIIGIGGSATNDGGAGMLRALGIKLLDHNGDDIGRGASGLADLVAVDISSAADGLDSSVFTVACDVTNPLCGENGASAVYGPQKGAAPEDISVLDGLLGHFADVVQKSIPGADPDHPGSGAAGGMGFALQAFMGASLERGIDIVIRETGLDELIRGCDLVITGEGKIDMQTAMGKTVSGIAGAARKYGKRVIAFAGVVEDGDEVCRICGIDKCCQINPEGSDPADIMNRDVARENLRNAVIAALQGC